MGLWSFCQVFAAPWLHDVTKTTKQRFICMLIYPINTPISSSSVSLNNSRLWCRTCHHIAISFHHTRLTDILYLLSVADCSAKQSPFAPRLSVWSWICLMYHVQHIYWGWHAAAASICSALEPKPLFCKSMTWPWEQTTAQIWFK